MALHRPPSTRHPSWRETPASIATDSTTRDEKVRQVAAAAAAHRKYTVDVEGALDVVGRNNIGIVSFQWGAGDNETRRNGPVVPGAAGHPASPADALRDPVRQRISLMAEPDNALDLILREVGVLLQPMQMAAAGPEQRAILFEALGWDLNAITGLPIAQIEQTVSALSAIADDLADGVDVSDFARIAQALPRAGEAFDAFNTIEATVRQTLPGIPAESLAADLINYVILRYLALRFPRIYAVLNVLTLIDEPATPRKEIIVATTQATVYHARPKSALRLDRLPRLFSEPAELFKEVYWPDGFTTQAHANEVADRLFPRLASLIGTFGGDVTYGITPVAGLTFGPGGDPLVPHMLTLRVPLPTYVADDGSTLRSAVSLTAGLVAGGNGDTDPGVILLPAAEAVFVVTTPTWQFEIEAGIAPVTFLVTRQGAFPDTADAQGDAKVTVQRLPGQAGAAVLIGSRDGTHFAIETISMQAGAHFAATGVDPEIGFDLLGGRLVIKAGDGDGFLKSVLPPDGMRMPFDFGMTWTPKTGVTLRGGATLELELPINLDLSIIKIPSMYLSLGLDIDPGRDPGVTLGVAATIELSIGPVYATVEQMGVAFMFTFPPHGGNLGALNLGIGFKPPKGMGASVSAGPVKGGGYLFIDAEKGEYAGILHLEIAGKFAITAIGLLNTRFPDGSEGFSLVVIISAEFPPINIGYGFFISGFGGIVGINRAMHVPALQDGIRRGVVGSLLFPVNPMPPRPPDRRRRRRHLPARARSVRGRPDGQVRLGARHDRSDPGHRRADSVVQDRPDRQDPDRTATDRRRLGDRSPADRLRRDHRRPRQDDLVRRVARRQPRGRVHDHR